MVSQKVGGTAGEGWITLDSLAPAIALPCLVKKVDIDGGEADLLRGAAALLQAAQVRWIVEIHSKSLEQENVSESCRLPAIA